MTDDPIVHPAGAIMVIALAALVVAVVALLLWVRALCISRHAWRAQARWLERVTTDRGRRIDERAREEVGT